MLTVKEGPGRAGVLLSFARTATGFDSLRVDQ